MSEAQNTPVANPGPGTGIPPGIPPLSQEQLRALAGLMLLNLQVHGGAGLWLADDDQPSDCTLARIAMSGSGGVWPGSLIVADFPGDHARSVTRHVTLHVADARSGPFKLDPSRRLVTFRAMDFALPPSWQVELYRDPREWLALALLVLEASVRSVLDGARDQASGAAAG
jgi:hypothetical protein